MSLQKILFVKHYSSNAKFILNDLEILKEKYDVRLYTAYTKKNLFIIFSFLKQFLFLLFNIHKYQLVYIWFADYHSMLPVMFAKFFNKKSVIAVGGYDATNIPEIDMGAFNEDNLKKKIRSYALKYSLLNANLMLVVDDSLIENTNTYIYSDDINKAPLKDGILNFIPQIRNKIRVVYTGFDEKFFERDENIDKENFVLSVGYTPNDNEFRRKGFDMLIETARQLKDINFTIIGVNEEQLKKFTAESFPNIKFLSNLDMNELRLYYSRAKVFAQLSLFEGQPNSLCEAMMLECIPVGSNVNGIPRVIGDTGYIVYKKNVKEISKKISEALNSPLAKGKAARRRIIENFSFERRRESILKIVKELMAKK